MEQKFVKSGWLKSVGKRSPRKKIPLSQKMLESKINLKEIDSN